MRTVKQLERVFHRVFPMALLAACAGPEPSLPDAQSLCTAPVFEPLGDLRPEASVDYMELRSYGYAELPSVVGRHGERCKRASDVPACEEAVAAAIADRGFESDPSALVPTGEMGPAGPTFLVVNRGDDVEVVTDMAGLNRALGSIDTLGEAALHVYLRNYSLDCAEAEGAKVGADFLVRAESGYACGAGTQREGHHLRVTPTGEFSVAANWVIEKGSANCAVGRRPHGLVAPAETQGVADCVGEFFAEVAHLEAASVDAFAQIEQELRAFGAPQRLIQRARRARADEVRHARILRGLAERRGAEVAVPQVRALEPRSLEAFAHDNAVEGCVRETFGALVAHVQATRARDAEVRRVMRGVARDETRHAALSWSIAAWAEARLDAAARARVRQARQAAVAQLHQDLGERFGVAVETEAGMPTPAEARAMLEAMADDLAQAA